MAIVLAGENPDVELGEKTQVEALTKEAGETKVPVLPETKKALGAKPFKLRWYVWVIAGVLVAGIVGGMAWYWGWWDRVYNSLTGTEDDGTDQDNGDLGPEEPVITYFENPINGVMIETEDAAEAMERRPLCVMIENHPDARPQYGLAEADLVYEALAEGGITRFMAVVWSTAPSRLMPIRSARAYYVKWATDIEGCIYHHIGEAHSEDPDINVRTVVNKYGVLRIGDRAFLRDSECRKEHAQEHCAYSLPETLWAEAEEEGWTGGIEDVQAYKFKDETDPVSATTGVTDYSTAAHSFHLTLTKGYSQNNYETVWTYDKATNSYKRAHGTLTKSTAHMDATTGTQLSAKNVVIMRVVERSTGDRKNHNEVEVIGTGTALILMDGKIIEATWSKPDGDTRTTFFDLTGNEIKFNRGKIWIQAMPTVNTVEVKTPAGAIVEL